MRTQVWDGRRGKEKGRKWQMRGGAETGRRVIDGVRETHTHKKRERTRGRERGKKRESERVARTKDDL